MPSGFLIGSPIIFCTIAGIAARRAALSAAFGTPLPPGGHRIVLAPDKTLVVKVVDAEGRPAVGVDLTITQQNKDSTSVRQRNEFRTEEPERIADLALGLFDGLGLRALLEDPRVDLSRARSLIAEVLGAELGVPAERLAAAPTALT